MQKQLKIIYLPLVVYSVFSLLLILLHRGGVENIASKIALRVGIVAILYIAWRGKKFFLFKSLLPLLFLGYFYNETAGLNHIFFHNLDPYISDLELSVFGFQPSILLFQNFGNYFTNNLMALAYISFYPFILAVALLYHKHRNHKYVEHMFVVQFSFYLFYAIFIAVPVIGPQYFFQGTDAYFSADGIFVNLLKKIQYLGELPTGAFPSSHVGISLIVMLYGLKLKSNIALFSVVLFVLLSLSTVYIKAHYALDVAAAFIITPFILVFAKKLFKLSDQKLT